MNKSLLGVIILFSVLATIIYTGNASAEDILVIGNRSVPVANLSHSDIKDIYLGNRKLWSNGLTVVFVKLGKNNITKRFLKTCVKKKPYSYKKYWYKKLYTGAGKPPRKFKNPKDLLEFVSTTKGAIGYINASAYDENVKVLSVIK